MRISKSLCHQFLFFVLASFAPLSHSNASPLITLDRMDCEGAMVSRPKIFKAKAGPWFRRTQQWTINKLASIERNLRAHQVVLAERYAENMVKFNAGLQEGFGLNQLLAPGPRELNEDWLKTYFARLQTLSDDIATEALGLGLELTISKDALKLDGELIEPNGAIVIRFDVKGGMEFITPVGQLRIFEQNLSQKYFRFMEMLVRKFKMRSVAWPTDGVGARPPQVYIINRDEADVLLPPAVVVDPKQARLPYLEQLERWRKVKTPGRELKQEPKFVEKKDAAGTDAAGEKGQAPAVEL